MGLFKIYQGSEDPPGPSWTPELTPKWTLLEKFQGTLDKTSPPSAREAAMSAMQHETFLELPLNTLETLSKIMKHP